ncbi:pPIWI_RE module domain-containing protein [Streptomyces sp. NPDC090032]|uniref:pPIWI_RE module domain-containing protein n=1 Tax=Streptomyces sp. NPDC090032 TaxID=3365925 RepID=UPI00380F078E
MPVNYQHIGTATWQPADADASHTARYRALPFPEQWRDAVLGLCMYGRDPQEATWRTAPTFRLEQVLQAYAPDVLVMPRPFHQREEGEPPRWLYAAEDIADPLPPQVLSTLVNHWLGGLRADLADDPGYRALLKDVRAELRAHPPQWEHVTRELLPHKQTPGGTAAVESDQFTLTPDWLARRVLDLGPYPYEGGSLRFRAMPRGRRDKGAELVSQPLPFEPEPGKGAGWFSVVLNIALHTVPFDPQPRFHLHWTVRRWATRCSATDNGEQRLRLPWGSATTVLLRPQVPVLPGVPLSERFAVTRLKRFRSRETGNFEDRWVDGGPAELLAGLAIGEVFPDVDALLGAPETWLARDMRAAIVHRPAMGRHQVAPGLMANQVSQLTAWAEQALPEQLRSATPMSRSRLAGPKPVNAPPTTVKKDEKENEEARCCRQRRAAAAHALSAYAPRDTLGRPVMEARLLWHTADLRDAALDALRIRLGLDGPGIDADAVDEAAYQAAAPGRPVLHEWRTPELTVRVRCLRPVVRTQERTGIDLTAGLDLPAEERRRPQHQDIAAAVHARRTATAQWLNGDRTDGTVGLTLIELRRADDFARGADPKFALRLGCADEGFVTQFVAVPQKVKGYNSVANMAHRAQMAWDDGLRQLGARVHPEHDLTEGIPENLRYAAVWMVRKNRTTKNRWPAHVPVAVLVTPKEPGSGLARVEGWDPEADDGAGAWVPYPQMLVGLARRAEVLPLPAPRTEDDSTTPAARRPSWGRDREQQRRAAEEWLQTIRTTLHRAPTMLLADAVNARSHWTWLQDGRTEPDRIRDGHAPARRLHPDLRLLRVRTATGRETAQWWGINPGEGPNGIGTHLWVPEDSSSGRIFCSTTPKPVQFRDTAIQADKLAPRLITQGKRKGEPTVDTGIQGWMPGLVELAVLGCHTADGDDPQALAMTAHLLRQPPDYPQALAHPLPLHLAALAQEYVLPTRAEDAPEGTDESGAAGDRLDDAAVDADPVTQAAAGLDTVVQIDEADEAEAVASSEEELVLFEL